MGICVKSLRYPTHKILVIWGDPISLWIFGLLIGISYCVVCRNRCVVHWLTALLGGPRRISDVFLPQGYEVVVKEGGTVTTLIQTTEVVSNLGP